MATVERRTFKSVTPAKFIQDTRRYPQNIFRTWDSNCVYNPVDGVTTVEGKIPESAASCCVYLLTHSSWPNDQAPAWTHPWMPPCMADYWRYLRAQFHCSIKSTADQSGWKCVAHSSFLVLGLRSAFQVRVTSKFEQWMLSQFTRTMPFALKVTVVLLHFLWPKSKQQTRWQKTCSSF